MYKPLVRLCVILFLAPTLTCASAWEQLFDSPDAAVDALVSALSHANQAELRSILGPEGTDLLSSGDAVEDAASRARFLQSYVAGHHLSLIGSARAELTVGPDAWSLPIPLVRAGQGWRFDTAQGKSEILVRRIGRNELEAMQVCLAIADAQHEYAASHLDADGVPVYARRLRSHPGHQDGLYWAQAPGDPPSPLGPLLAAAAIEGYRDPHLLRGSPYRGYYFRLLDGQGPHARDGARAYLVRGKPIGGFAVIAVPARYGVSGVASFLLNQDGTLFERNLGPRTADVAAAISTFDPAAGWTEVHTLP